MCIALSRIITSHYENVEMFCAIGQDEVANVIKKHDISVVRLEFNRRTTAFALPKAISKQHSGPAYPVPAIKAIIGGDVFRPQQDIGVADLRIMS